MNEETKAASVDSPEFRELVREYAMYYADHKPTSAIKAGQAFYALITHINAWGNQLAASRAMLPVTDSDVIEKSASAIESYGNSELAAKLRALASPVAGWVSVEERLPPDDSLVMVYVPNSQYAKVQFDTWQMQREAPVSFSSETVEIGFGWDEHEFEEITHWMPLPPAPVVTPTQQEPEGCEHCIGTYCLSNEICRHCGHVAEGQGIKRTTKEQGNG